MAADLGPAWIALAGGLAGTLGGFVGTRTSLRGARDLAADQQAHERVMAEDARRSLAERERLSYEVETLLELQIVVHRTIRVCGRFFSWHLENEGQVDSERPIDKFLEEQRSNMRQLLEVDAALILLSSRIADDEVRVAASAGRLAANRLRFAPDLNGAMDHWDEARKHLNAAQERIGTLLQDLPPPTVFRPIVSEMWREDLD